MSSLIKSLVSVVNVLETYRGKDRFIRWSMYAAMFMGGDGKTQAQIKWKTISGEMGGCRVILRLFDDLPMLLYNMSKGFGLKEKGLMQVLEVLTCLLNQGFYPSEHIAWLKEKNILKGSPLPMLLLGLFIWAISLVTEIAKALLSLRNLGICAHKLRKQKDLDKDGSGEGSIQNSQIKEKLKKLAEESKDIKLNILHSACDLVNAISWFPSGFLWSSKLSPSTNGIIGLIASTVMLYRNWPSASPNI